MRYTSISYTKKFNLGNYESEQYSISADIEEGDDVSDSVAILRQKVHAMHEHHRVEELSFEDSIVEEEVQF